MTKVFNCLLFVLSLLPPLCLLSLGEPDSFGGERR